METRQLNKAVRRVLCIALFLLWGVSPAAAQMSYAGNISLNAGEVSTVSFKDVSSIRMNSSAYRRGGERKLTLNGSGGHVSIRVNGRNDTFRYDTLNLEIVADGLSESYATPISAHDLNPNRAFQFTSNYLNVCNQVATHVSHINRVNFTRYLEFRLSNDYRIVSLRSQNGGKTLTLKARKKSSPVGTYKDVGDALECWGAVARNGSGVLP